MPMANVPYQLDTGNALKALISTVTCMQWADVSHQRPEDEGREWQTSTHTALARDKCSKQARRMCRQQLTIRRSSSAHELHVCRYFGNTTSLQAHTSSRPVAETILIPGLLGVCLWPCPFLSTSCIECWRGCICLDFTEDRPWRMT